MKKETLIIWTFVITCFSLFAITHIPEGDVSGTWTSAGNPYVVHGDITIPDGLSLFIYPGTQIEFSSNYGCYVQGRIVAFGTALDSVCFTGPESSGWHGIRFDNTSATNDSSRFQYCIFTNGKVEGTSANYYDSGGAFMINTFDKVVIEKSRFNNCYAESYGGAVFLHNSSVSINDCVFTQCSSYYMGGAIYGDIGHITVTNNSISGCQSQQGGGLFLWNLTDCIVTNNNIFDNSADLYGGAIFLKYITTGILDGNNVCNNYSDEGGGFYLYNADVICCNNVICNNTGITGGGLYLRYHEFPIQNNTICYNSAEFGGGIYFGLSSNGTVKNGIISANQSIQTNQIFTTPSENPVIEYCNWEDCSDFSLYPHCFSSSPDFTSPPAGAGIQFDGMAADWSMQSTSLTINAGDPDFVATTAIDIAGNPRVRDDIIDCGAYEYQSDPAIRCSFEASAVSGCIPLVVQFYGICNAVDALFEWDFNNDGVIDSDEKNPQYSYDDVGIYTVSLHVENGAANDDCIRTDFITTYPLSTLSGTISTNTTLPSGAISVTGDVAIAQGVTLTILPGTVLEFQDYYRMDVHGCLLAQGVSADSIRFTVADTTGFYDITIPDGGWSGLYFDCSDPATQSSQLDYCIFEYGKALGGAIASQGGAMYNQGENELFITNSRFSHNRAAGNGGAVFANAPTHLNGCILEYNSAVNGGALATAELVTLNDCILQNNQADEQGGALYTDYLIKINNSIVRDNTAGIDGGGLCSWSWADIDGSTFVGNSADNFGGGVCFNHYGHVWVTNSIFSNNQSDDWGGGLYVSCDTDFSIINSLVCNNSGDGIVIDNTDSHIANCDFVNNEGEGIVQLAPPWDGEKKDDAETKLTTDETKAVCYNSINWGNSEGENWISTSYEIYNVDPHFTAPSAGSGIQYDGLAADWRFLETSMCINFGTADTTGLNLPDVDLDGNPRIFDGVIGRVDIGPYEYQDDQVRPYLYCDKSSLNFGVITLGNPEEDQLVTLYNVGTEELIISSITMSEGFEVQILGQQWTTQLVDIHILPGQFKFINVRFNPEAIGIYDGQLTIESNHVEPVVTIPVSGQCIVSAVHVGGLYTGSPIWDAEYIIFDGDVTVNGDSLTIMPGVHLFMDDAQLSVTKSLIARGTETDSIYFTSSYGHTRGKIQLGAYGSGTSRLEYCVIENSAFGGLDSGCSSTFSYHIKHCLIQNNQGAGMYLNCGNSVIEDCIIRNNHGGGFLGNGIVNRCIFTGNEGNSAIRQGGTITHLDVANSLIYNNESGLDIQICDLWNCTIVNNGSGLFWECVNHSNIMKNCILWGNDANGVQITLDNSTYHQGAIYNSCIQGGFDNLVINGTIDMIYENNIDADPLFVGASVADYHLDAGSSCIDAGTNDVASFVNPGDLAHHQRIWDGDNSGVATIDMGCYEAEAPLGVQQMNPVPAVTALLGNYPNPFKPSGAGRGSATTICYSLAQDAKVQLDVYNIRGQKVKSLISTKQEVGYHTVSWNGTDDTDKALGSGVYFYRLKLKNQTSTGKCLLLK